MRFIRLIIVFLNLGSATLAFSQISHGGTPYFLQPSILKASSSTLRASSSPFFIEMPSFDLDSVLRENAVNEERSMRGSYQFAHKFYTHIDLNDAVSTVLPDGTTVRQIGIRSAGAYSINLLLSDFEIPRGGKLFIYSVDHSYVVGSFDDRNNSPDKILPVQPVPGESIIVEYSEPADVPFAGNFTIAEVNHDFRDFFRREPAKDDITKYACMKDVFCAEENVAEETIRSTVLLLISGTAFCSGVLLNNTADDGKPYLLTGNHCLCSPSSLPAPADSAKYFNDRARTIIAFFNYNRPVCDENIKMKGSEEMSLAGAAPVVVLPRKDIALLEFQNLPPNYYNAYYAGWNNNLTASGTEHTNIHHPSGAVKKYGMTRENIQIVSVPAPSGNYLDADSYWRVPLWTIGSTNDGSSGSPLFDENNLVIGGLTGGASVCSGTSPSTGKVDYFSVLGKGWQTGNQANQLKTYLDPKNKGVLQYPGMDPNQLNPVIRRKNSNYTDGDLLITSKLTSPNSGCVFGNSNLQTFEFAEEFSNTGDIEILGAYLMIPDMPFNYTSGVKVFVYTGNTAPENKIDSTSFVPRYLDYSSSLGFYPVDKNTDITPTETFVVFDKPIRVAKELKKFFISYSINNSNTAQFCVYNTQFKNSTQSNTAWVKNAAKGWVSADKYDYYLQKTSLAVQPLIRNYINNSTIPVPVQDNGFYYDRSGKMLILKEPINKQGQIAVYSIGGQLLEKIQLQQEKTSYLLHERQKGTIGIVKITSIDYSGAGKIMY